MTPTTFPLKQTPFIAVVVPEMHGHLIKDIKIVETFCESGIGLSYPDSRGCSIIPLPPGEWELTIPSVRKATEEEAEKFLYSIPPTEEEINAVRVFQKDHPDEYNKWDNIPNDDDSQCKTDFKGNLYKLLTASMPEGMLLSNPYGEKEPEVEYVVHNSKAPLQKRIDWVTWHSAQSKVVSDCAVLRRKEG